MSLIFLVQFVSITNGISGLPLAYKGMSDSFAWASLKFDPPESLMRQPCGGRKPCDETDPSFRGLAVACRVPCAVCRVPCAVCRVPCTVHVHAHVCICACVRARINECTRVLPAVHTHTHTHTPHACSHTHRAPLDP